MNQKLVLISRIILGLVFTVFGFNGLLMFTLGKGFIPAPPPTGDMLIIFNGFMAMKYIMPLVKLLEVIAGVLLLSNRFMNLAIILLGPIVVNILLIHLVVERTGAPMAIIITGLFIVLVKNKWVQFKFVLEK